MICPFVEPNIQHKQVYEYNDKGKVRSISNFTRRIPIECLKDKCPFYSDGTGDYREGVCIKLEKELED